MGHLIIILYNVVLIEGLAISFYLFHQQKSFPFSYLKDITNKLLLINSYVLIRLVTYYLKQNMTRTAKSEVMWNWIIPAELLLSFLIVFLLAYYFLKISNKLLGQTLPPRLIHLLIGLLLAVTLFHGIAITIHFTKKSSDLIYFAKTLHNLLGMLIIFLALNFMIFRGHKIPSKDSKKVALSFGYPYLFIIVGILLLILFPNQFDIYILAFLFIFINTFNFIWFKYSFLKHIGLSLGMINKAQVLKAIENYQLSNREGEILELLLQGKENKEIEELLFISINTVKNHVHNIFKKMEVNTRSQLFKKFQKK